MAYPVARARSRGQKQPSARDFGMVVVGEIIVIRNDRLPSHPLKQRYPGLVGPRRRASLPWRRRRRRGRRGRRGSRRWGRGRRRGRSRGGCRRGSRSGPRGHDRRRSWRRGHSRSRRRRRGGSRPRRGRGGGSRSRSSGWGGPRCWLWSGSGRRRGRRGLVVTGVRPVVRHRRPGVARKLIPAPRRSSRGRGVSTSLTRAMNDTGGGTATPSGLLTLGRADVLDKSVDVDVLVGQLRAAGPAPLPRRRGTARRPAQIKLQVGSPRCRVEQHRQQRGGHKGGGHPHPVSTSHWCSPPRAVAARAPSLGLRH